MEGGVRARACSSEQMSRCCAWKHVESMCTLIWMAEIAPRCEEVSVRVWVRGGCGRGGRGKG